MVFIDAAAVGKYLGWQELIAALKKMFASGCVAPVRHHHAIHTPGQQEATMLIMPAWQTGKYLGLKLVNVFPDNPEKGLPTIHGSYLLMDGTSGEVLSVMDAGELTARRTVAASALASSYLSKKEARKLLIVGSGRIAEYLGFAHGAVRPLDEIRIWARNTEKAGKLAEIYLKSGYACKVSTNLEEDSSRADVISCATMSTEPLVQGKWLKAGVHIDLIGAFKPKMRETDDEVITRSRIFVDTRDGALAEAGDLLQPMEKGLLRNDDIVAELHELVTAKMPGRKSEDEITLFKSVGAALEDLAAAILCYENRLRE